MHFLIREHRNIHLACGCALCGSSFRFSAQEKISTLKERIRGIERKVFLTEDQIQNKKGDILKMESGNVITLHFHEEYLCLSFFCWSQTAVIRTIFHYVLRMEIDFSFHFWNKDATGTNGQIPTRRTHPFCHKQKWHKRARGYSPHQGTLVPMGVMYARWYVQMYQSSIIYQWVSTNEFCLHTAYWLRFVLYCKLYFNRKINRVCNQVRYIC